MDDPGILRAMKFGPNYDPKYQEFERWRDSLTRYEMSEVLEDLMETHMDDFNEMLFDYWKESQEDD